MFYSTDLLNVRGGQFNLIWLMSTTHDSKTLAKKRQKELIATNLGKMCEGVSRMLPVAGKEKSFSLRTSSYLVHGLAVCFKLKVVHLNNDAQRMLMTSIRAAVPIASTIDDEGVKANVTRIPCQDQEDFGIIADHIDENLFNLFDMTTEEHNARKKAVTMTEVDPPTSKRLIEEWGDEGFSFNDGNPLENLTNFDVLPPLNEEVAAPVKPRGGSDPRIEVTEIQDEETSNPFPHIPAAQNADLPVVPDIVIEQPVFDDTVEPLLPPPVIEVSVYDPKPPNPPSLIDEQQPDADPGVNVPSVIVQPPEEEVPNEVQLDPVVVGPQTKKRRKRTIRHLIVDEETQIPMEEIKRGIQDYRDLLRCEDPVAERVSSRKQVPKKYSGIRLGSSLRHVFKESLGFLEGFADHDHDDEVVVTGGPPTEDASLLRNEGSLAEREKSNAPSLLLNTDEGQDNLLQVPENSILEFSVDVHSSTRNDVPMFEKPGDDVNIEPPRMEEEMDAVAAFEPGLDPVPEEALIPVDVNVEVPDEIPQPEDRDPDILGTNASPSESVPQNETLSDDILVSSFIEIVKSKMRPSNEGTFGELLNEDSDAKDVASKFYSLLVANKKELLTCEQDSCYGEISIKLSL